MLRSAGLSSFYSWFFIASLMVSSLQVTLAGYQSENDSWFSILTMLIAEEEGEESEKEEKEEKESAKDWVALHQTIEALWNANKYTAFFKGAEYKSVLKEVVSPPPEA